MGFISGRCSSFRFAFKGVGYAFRTQPNLWIESVAAGSVVAAGFFFGISPVEWIFVSISMGAVFSAEIINTAIEKLVDLISPERQELAGIVKDLGAGAVLTVSIMALVTGLIIFIPRICHLIATGIV
jgi:diacylglycerol kinase (ATP)